MEIIELMSPPIDKPIFSNVERTGFTTVRIPVSKTVLKTMRLPFLTLTMVCVLLGVANTLWAGHDVNWFDALLCLTGALAAHISVNTFNEAQDFVSGLDLQTVRTPFSGGSGGLVANPNALTAVNITAIVSLLITCSIGGFFIIEYGLAIAPLGLLGVVIILTYTKYLNKMPIICLCAPGLAFGWLMVLGSSFVLSGEFILTAWFTGGICVFLVSNLLLLNQIPDVDADKSVGRNHFVIAYSIPAALNMYLLLLILAVLTLLLAVYFNYLPRVTLFAIMPMCLGLVSYRGLKSMYVDKKNPAVKQSLKQFSTQLSLQTSLQHRYLAMNVVVANVTPFVLALCLIFTASK